MNTSDKGFKVRGRHLEQNRSSKDDPTGKTQITPFIMYNLIGTAGLKKKNPPS